MEQLLPFSEIANFKFHKRPFSVPADLRYYRKLSQIVLILDLCSIGKKCSIFKLQLFNWSFSASENMQKFLNFIKFDSPSLDLWIRLDPSLNRSIDFGVADGYIEVTNNGHLKLTNKGKVFSTSIFEDKKLLEKEKEFLKNIGKVPESKIKKIISGIK